MIDRFGQTEMIRLSEPEDRTAEAVNPAKIELAIADAAALINDYLRKRYRVPLVAVPLSVTRSACVLARYDLAQGERTNPTEEMRLARKEVIAWLEGLSKGEIELDGVPSGSGPSPASGARVSDRSRPFDHDRIMG
ncbi:DUF1320 domain-containing protein [Fulvimarina endophytica]|uniref:DUF1320 domain-containing protein n=2 Tax=Fulvimarina endophytica TaxID=2293836 RepID=A0A371X303_9HYPH|nr:DUF1320 domain-containing protein [Fulvimarina endophytica]